MKRSAHFSPGEVYRFLLIREAQPICACERCKNVRPKEGAPPRKSGHVLWCLCNPSMASDIEDDPTERRMWGFTSRWGYDGFMTVNTNPYRATNPNNQMVPPEKILMLNDDIVRTAAQNAAIVVVGWGANANRVLANRITRVLQRSASDKIYVLGRTKDGTPKHPLYLPNNAELVKWTNTDCQAGA